MDDLNEMNKGAKGMEIVAEPAVAMVMLLAYSLGVLPLWTLLLASVVGAGPAMSQSLSINPSDYRIISAPEFKTGRAGSARNFFWIDNERLLFLVNDRELSMMEKKDGRTVI